MSAVHGNNRHDASDVIREAGSDPVPLHSKPKLPDDWRPSATLEVIRRRAELLDQIRDFMRGRSILEVDTPILDTAGNPDPHIENLTTNLKYPDSTRELTCYLHTSPEFAMKRMLAAGSGPIYQICKVFRNNETGRLHQTEFTMLEWYRPGYDHHELMDELGRLLEILDFKYPVKTCYAEVFKHYTSLDPHEAGLEDLQSCAGGFGMQAESGNRSLLLDIIYSHAVTPNLGKKRPQLIYNYPACQAALARVVTGPPAVAERFELFIDGVEIANGYNELNDVLEQDSRFRENNIERREAALPEIPIDDRLLDALQVGLPPCAGVALGLDRLLMLITGSRNLAEVLSYPLRSGD